MNLKIIDSYSQHIGGGGKNSERGPAFLQEIGEEPKGSLMWVGGQAPGIR